MWFWIIMKQVRLSAFCLIHFLFSFKAEQSTLKGVSCLVAVNVHCCVSAVTLNDGRLECPHSSDVSPSVFRRRSAPL